MEEGDLPKLNWIDRRGTRGFYSWSALRSKMKWTVAGVMCGCLKCKNDESFSFFSLIHTTCLKKRKKKSLSLLYCSLLTNDLRQNESNGSNPTKQNQRLWLSDCIRTVWLSLFLCCANSCISWWTEEDPPTEYCHAGGPRALEQKLCVERAIF